MQCLLKEHTMLRRRQLCCSERPAIFHNVKVTYSIMIQRWYSGGMKLMAIFCIAKLPTQYLESLLVRKSVGFKSTAPITWTHYS